MDVKPQTRLHFTGVDISNVEFRSVGQYNTDEEINLSVDCKVYYPKDDHRTFRILMAIKMRCPEAFELNVSGIGNFEIDSDIDQAQRSAFVNMNAPAIMFPYMRSFITTLTANLGNATGSLTIPPHFFKGTIEEYVES